LDNAQAVITVVVLAPCPCRRARPGSIPAGSGGRESAPLAPGTPIADAPTKMVKRP